MGGLTSASSTDLGALAEPARGRLLERHEAREIAYAASRDVIRDAANAIRAIHRGEHDRADELCTRSAEHLACAVAAAETYPDVLHGGFVQDAMKELAEAHLTRALLTDVDVPGPDELGVDDISWLHGLAETVGELRRAALDRVRRGALDEAEGHLDVMQEILSVLATIDVPDGLSRGLRRATDAGRAITERTRGDLTTAAGQRQLHEALDEHRAVLERVLRDR